MCWGLGEGECGTIRVCVCECARVCVRASARVRVCVGKGDKTGPLDQSLPSNAERALLG